VDLQRPGGDPVLSASPDVAICACRYGIIVTQLGDREEEARPCFSLPVAWSHTEIRHPYATHIEIRHPDATRAGWGLSGHLSRPAPCLLVM